MHNTLGYHNTQSHAFKHRTAHKDKHSSLTQPLSDCFSTTHQLFGILQPIEFITRSYFYFE